MEDEKKSREQLIEELKGYRHQIDEKESLAFTLSSIVEGVITTDMDGKVVLMNKAAEELTGWTREEALSKDLGAVFHIIDEKTRKQYKNPIEKVIKTMSASHLPRRTILVNKSGLERVISDSGAIIRDRENNAIGTVIVFHDVTEKVRADEESYKVSKIESINALAGGIAHDFNNILTVILGNISLVRMYMNNENIDKVKERIVDVEKASLQAKELTKQLLEFSKGGAPIVKPCTISGLLKDTISFSLCGSNVQCELFVHPDIWPVEIDEGQISQVINNLIINAKQSMPDGGTIRIIGENIIVGSEQKLPLNSGKYVMISIKDTGYGIPEALLHKIFDPYFTTKPAGNGLGLSTSYTIMKNHGGYITAESKPGEGSAFFIYIPSSTENVENIEKDEELITGEGKILVMDDDERIRDITGQMLERLGYKVNFARDGSEAIELYIRAKRVEEPFDAVIMDLTIPGGMGGKEAVRQLLKLDPNAKAIVVSGYSNDCVIDNFAHYGFRGAIIKPSGIQELSKAIHSVIRGA